MSPSRVACIVTMKMIVDPAPCSKRCLQRRWKTAGPVRNLTDALEYAGAADRCNHNRVYFQQLLVGLMGRLEQALSWAYLRHDHGTRALEIV